MIKPTIGRVVWYHPPFIADSDSNEGEYFKQRYAAKLEDERKALEAVAQLERTNAALLGALKRLATEMAYVHEAADMVRQGADVNLVCSSEGQEALKQARAAIAEAKKENN